MTLHTTLHYIQLPREGEARISTSHLFEIWLPLQLSIWAQEGWLVALVSPTSEVMGLRERQRRGQSSAISVDSVSVSR